MLKRLKRKEAKVMNEHVDELTKKMESLKEGALPLKEKAISLKQTLEAERAKQNRLGYQKLHERLNYVLSYFQDYDQNILDAKTLINDLKEGNQTDDDITDIIANFDEYILELIDIKVELSDIEDELNVLSKKKTTKSSVLEFKEFGDMIGDAFKKAFTKDDSSNPNSKTSKLLKILPFLAEEEKAKIVEEILLDSEYFQDVKLAVILPFLSQEDCDKIFMHEVKKDSKTLQTLVPFVSEELLSELVNQYIEGKIDMNMDILYPFLKMEDIKKLFFYELKQEN